MNILYEDASSLLFWNTTKSVLQHLKRRREFNKGGGLIHKMTEKDLFSLHLISSLMHKIPTITIDEVGGHSTARLSSGFGISGQQTFLSL